MKHDVILNDVLSHHVRPLHFPLFLALKSSLLSLTIYRHAHKHTVMEVKWNMNGNWLLTASRDHLVKLFDIRNMKEEMQTFKGHKKEATSKNIFYCHQGTEYLCHGVINVSDHPRSSVVYASNFDLHIGQGGRWYCLISNQNEGPFCIYCVTN